MFFVFVIAGIGQCECSVCGRGGVRFYYRVCLLFVFFYVVYSLQTHHHMLFLIKHI